MPGILQWKAALASLWQGEAKTALYGVACFVATTLFSSIVPLVKSIQQQLPGPQYETASALVASMHQLWSAQPSGHLEWRGSKPRTSVQVTAMGPKML